METPFAPPSGREGTGLIQFLICGGPRMTQNAPTLAVTEGNAAVEFYENAFGAKLLWKLGEQEVVAGTVDRWRQVLSRARSAGVWDATFVVGRLYQCSRRAVCR
jgi:hypothetical protein